MTFSNLPFVSEIAVLVCVADHLRDLMRIEHCTPSRRRDRDRIDALVAGQRSDVLTDRIVHLTRRSAQPDQVAADTWRDHGCLVINVRDLAERRLDDDQLEAIARQCLASKNRLDVQATRPIVDDRFDYSDRPGIDHCSRSDARA